MKLAYMSTYGTNCVHSLVVGRNEMYGRTLFEDLIVTADDDYCSFPPTLPSKVLQWALFMKQTYVGTYSAKCVSSLVLETNLMSRRTLFEYTVWKDNFLRI